MLVDVERTLGQYGFSRDIKKSETECRECVYLEGLTTATKEKICKICDDFKMNGSEHVRKFENMKYTNKETIKVLLDL